MNKGTLIGFVIGVVAIIGVIAYVFIGRDEPAPPAVPDEPKAETYVPEPEPQAAPPVQYPLPKTTPAPEQPPLPVVGESDEPVRDSLKELFGEEPVETFLVPKKIVQRIVVTVNSLDGEPVPARARAVPKLPGPLIVEGEGDALTLSDDNAERYKPFLMMMQEVGSERIAGWYFRYYPLFQQAYEELGYPGRYFNDRVIQVIDHLLAAPEVEGPVRLVQPKVIYEFADAELEDLSSGQKLMLRVGSRNAAVIKDKLRKIRALIVERTESLAETPADASASADAQKPVENP